MGELCIILLQSSGAEWRAEFLCGLSMSGGLCQCQALGHEHGTTVLDGSFLIPWRPLLDGEQERSCFHSLPSIKKEPDWKIRWLYLLVLYHKRVHLGYWYVVVWWTQRPCLAPCMGRAPASPGSSRRLSCFLKWETFYAFRDGLQHWLHVSHNGCKKLCNPLILLVFEFYMTLTSCKVFL